MNSTNGELLAGPERGPSVSVFLKTEKKTVCTKTSSARVARTEQKQTVQALYGSNEGKLQHPKRKRVFDMNTCYADQDL